MIARPVKAVVGFLEFLTDSEGSDLWYGYIGLAVVNGGWILWAGFGWWSSLGLVWPVLILGPYVFFILVVGVLGLPSMIWEWIEDRWYERRQRKRAGR